MEENTIEIGSIHKTRSEADAYIEITSSSKKMDPNEVDPEESGTSANKSQIRQILGMDNSLGLGLEALRVQLAEEHFMD